MGAVGARSGWPLVETETTAPVDVTVVTLFWLCKMLLTPESCLEIPEEINSSEFLRLNSCDYATPSRTMIINRVFIIFILN